MLGQLNNVDMANDTDNVSKVIMMWKDKCLFLQKDDKTWELPGGHLNVGEKFKAGAIREVFEETGIKLTKLKLIFKQRDFRLYCATPKILNVKLSDEHIDYKWVRYSDIRRLSISNATKQNIQIILNTIKGV